MIDWPTDRRNVWMDGWMNEIINKLLKEWLNERLTVTLYGSTVVVGGEGLYHTPKSVYDNSELLDFIESSLEQQLDLDCCATVIIAGEFNQPDVSELASRVWL